MKKRNKKIDFLVLRPTTTNVLKVADHQNGKVKSLKRDKGRIAMSPGKRVSKNGKIYYEYRKNRTDMAPKTV